MSVPILVEICPQWALDMSVRSREIIHFIPKSCIFGPSWPWPLTFLMWPCYFRANLCWWQVWCRSVYNEPIYCQFYAWKLYFWPLVTLTFDLWPFWCHHVTSQCSFYVGGKFGGDLSVISRELIYFMPQNSISDPSWPWPLTFWNFRCPYVSSRVSLYACAKFGGDLSINSGEMICFMPENCIFDPSWPWPLTFDLFDAPMIFPEF
jgi:hypothetical protein